MRQTFGNAEQTELGRARTGRSARRGRKPEPTPLSRTGPADLEAFGRTGNRERDGRRSLLRIPDRSDLRRSSLHRGPERQSGRSSLRQGWPGKPRELAPAATRKGPDEVRFAGQPWDLSNGASAPDEDPEREPTGAERPRPEPAPKQEAGPRARRLATEQWGLAAMPAPIFVRSGGPPCAIGALSGVQLTSSHNGGDLGRLRGTRAREPRGSARPPRSGPSRRPRGCYRRAMKHRVPRPVAHNPIRWRSATASLSAF
jgi:hypothetical protein